MIICLCSEGKTLEDKISSVFGRAPYFLIYNDKDKTYRSIENSAKNEAHGAGTNAAQIILDENVGVLITSALGPNAKEVLDSSSITVFHQVGETPQEALAAYQEGNLEEF